MTVHAPCPGGRASTGASLFERRSELEQKQAGRIRIVLFVTALFFGFELFGARAAGSDVLLADAYHMLMDVFALGINLGAMYLASMRPNARFTFGLRRAEPLAALANGVLILGLCVELVRDAVADLAHHTAPKSTLMLAVASIALVVNGLSAWLIHGVMHAHASEDGHANANAADSHAHRAHRAHHAHRAHQSDSHAHSHARADVHASDHALEDGAIHRHVEGPHLNLRGAWLHLLGDALGSLAAFAAGLALRFGASPIVDPLSSFVVVGILVIGALRLIRDASLVLLEAAPPRLGVERIRARVLGQPGVTSIHALHVWSLGTGHDAISVHVVSDGSRPALGAALGDALRAELLVEYVTVQVDVFEHGA